MHHVTVINCEPIAFVNCKITNVLWVDDLTDWEYQYNGPYDKTSVPVMDSLSLCKLQDY